jgi:hypothetical protein
MWGMRPHLRIVVFPETRRTWTARGLDRDLSAEGRTVEAALDTLLRITRAHFEYDLRHHREPLSAFASAPAPYWDAFARGTHLMMSVPLDWSDGGVPPLITATLVTQHPGLLPVERALRSA